MDSKQESVVPLSACCGVTFGARRDSVVVRFGEPQSRKSGYDSYIPTLGIAVGYKDGRTVSGIRVYQGDTRPVLGGLDLLDAPRAKVVELVRAADPGAVCEQDALASTVLELRLWTRDVEDRFDLLECGPKGFLQHAYSASAEQLRARLSEQLLVQHSESLDERYNEAIDDLVFLGFDPCPSLKKAFLVETGIGDLTATWLGKCHSLEEVFVSRTFVTEVGAQELSRLPRLRRLGLAYLQLSGDFMSNLPEHLEEIALENVSLRPESWRQLGRLEGLRRLRLRSSSFSSADVQYVEGLPGLQLLDLGGCSVSQVERMRLRDLVQSRLGAGEDASTLWLSEVLASGHAESGHRGSSLEGACS